MQVHLIRNEKGIEEWMILEMQGTVEGSEIEGQLLGNFIWRKDNSEALLLIGHHLLEGKIIILDKPLLVASSEIVELNKTNNERKNLIVEGIVTRRIVFKNRPKPIVSKE